MERPACNKQISITMTSMQERYDLVILGSGSTAFAAALPSLAKAP